MVDISETPELIQNILLYADYNDIMNYCRTSKLAVDICKSLGFWAEKAKHDMKVPGDLFNSITKISRIIKFRRRNTYQLKILNSEQTCCILFQSQ